MKLPLIAILLSLLNSSKNEIKSYDLQIPTTTWELVSYNEKFASYKYHISESDKIYLAKKSNCYKMGWVYCNFLISSDVKIFKNGTAIFVHNKYMSDIPVDTLGVEIKWVLKKQKLQFDKSKSIVSLQDSIFFKWITE